MATKIICNKKQTALTLGILFAALYFIWVLMISMGNAQSFLNWIAGLCFISNPYTLSAFSAGVAIKGLISYFVIGAIIGYAFAYIWNRLNKYKL